MGLEVGDWFQCTAWGGVGFGSQFRVTVTPVCSLKV